MSGDNEFCGICGVLLSLHPSEGESDEAWECSIAEQKALLLKAFASVGRRP